MDQSLLDGNFELLMQSDGNLVLYACGNAIWASGTNGHSNAFLLMQRDGNLVIYTQSLTALWSTHTSGNSGAYLRIQSDGNVVVYNSSNVALWNTATTTAPGCTDILFAGNPLYLGNPSGPQDLVSENGQYEFSAFSIDVEVWNVQSHASLWLDQDCGDNLYAEVSSGYLDVYSNGELTCQFGSGASGGSYLQLEDDGNLILYTDFRTQLWSSFSAG